MALLNVAGTLCLGRLCAHCWVFQHREDWERYRRGQRYKQIIKKLNDLDSNAEAKDYMAHILGREQEAQVTIQGSGPVFVTSRKMLITFS